MNSPFQPLGFIFLIFFTAVGVALILGVARLVLVNIRKPKEIK